MLKKWPNIYIYKTYKLFLVAPFQHENFYLNFKKDIEVKQLKTIVI
jgi:hypothetical protein